MQIMSLRTKALLGVSASFFAVILVIGTYFSFQIVRLLQEEYQSKGLSIAYSVANTATDAILNNDPALLQSMIDELARMDGVGYVAIYDGVHHILVHTFSPQVPPEIAPFLTQIGRPGGQSFEVLGHPVLDVQVPILHGEIGSVHIGMNLEVIQRQAFVLIGQAAGLVLVIYLGTVFGLWLLIRRITRPLQRLTLYADRLSTHDFKTPLTDGAEIQNMAGYNQTEVRALADGFIRLETSLTQNLADLETSLKTQERLESELSIAAEIQGSLLPQSAETHYDSAVVQQFFRPAKAVGGDFLDHFLIHHRYLMFTVGDVSGKGVSAALIMATVLTMIRSTAQSVDSPGEILTVVNSAFSKRNPGELFITVFLGILDLHTGELRFANAGHNPPYRNGGGSNWQWFGTEQDLVMGIDEAVYYRDQTIILNANETIVLYSDGITEAQNEQGDCWGDEALLSALSENSESIILGIVSKTDAFSGSALQADDQTLMSIRYQGETMSADPSHVAVYFENKIDEIQKLAQLVERFTHANGLLPQVAMNLNLVLEELISNTIYYGYDDHQTHHIFVEIHQNHSEIQVKITDDGIAFDPMSAPEVDVDAVLEDRHIGGLGIHFVRALVKAISYRRENNQNITELSMEVNVDATNN